MAIDPGQPVRVTAVRTNRIVVVLDDSPRELLSETADVLAQPARNLGLESLDLDKPGD